MAENELASKRRAVGLPAKGKLLANVGSMTADERARAGITDEMANAQVSSNQPKLKGVKVHKDAFQASSDHDVETQVRIIDHENNEVLFSGSEAQYAKLKKVINSKE
jgi:hypothetical protein